MRNGLAMILRAALVLATAGWNTASFAQSLPVLEKSPVPRAMPTFWMPDEGSGWIDFPPGEGGHIVIPVVLNGEPVRALIDTGVPDVLISKMFADEHHLLLTPWGRSRNSGGPADNYLTPIASLTVGALHTIKPGFVSVADISNLSGGSLGRFDVIIGLSLLGAFGWEVDQDHHRFRFVRSGLTVSDHPLPIRLANSRLFTEIGTGGKSVSSVVIDTGSDATVSLTAALAEAIGFQGETDLASMGIGGMVVQPLGRLHDFTIGGHSFPTTYATSGDDWYAPEGGKALIGMGFLQNYNIVADPPAGKMFLIPRAGPLPPFPKSTSGVQGTYRDGRVMIVHVMKNSPAAASGLKAGDAICAIDGKPMPRDLDDQHWGRAAPGTRYRLTLCDGSDSVLTLQSFY